MKGSSAPGYKSVLEYFATEEVRGHLGGGGG